MCQDGHISISKYQFCAWSDIGKIMEKKNRDERVWEVNSNYTGYRNHDHAYMPINQFTKAGGPLSTNQKVYLKIAIKYNTVKELWLSNVTESSPIWC